jgi:AcrR family transcriptional regulator
VLVAAIHQATLAELIENGFSKLTMEAVAARAETGKATLYRRWPDKVTLVLSAVEQAFPEVPTFPPDAHRTLRGDLLSVHLMMARSLCGPGGALSRALVAVQEQSPLLMQLVQQRVIEPRVDALRQALAAAALRGEAAPGSATSHLAEVGPALVLHHFFVHGTHGLEERARAVVDDVVIPLATMSRP